MKFWFLPSTSSIFFLTKTNKLSFKYLLWSYGNSNSSLSLLFISQKCYWISTQGHPHLYHNVNRSFIRFVLDFPHYFVHVCYSLHVSVACENLYVGQYKFSESGFMEQPWTPPLWFVNSEFVHTHTSSTCNCCLEHPERGMIFVGLMS